MQFYTMFYAPACLQARDGMYSEHICYVCLAYCPSGRLCTRTHRLCKGVFVRTMLCLVPSGTICKTGRVVASLSASAHLLLSKNEHVRAQLFRNQRGLTFNTNARRQHKSRGE